MFRALPVMNRILDEKWKKRTRKVNLFNLNQVKPSIDLTPPRSCSHLKYNLKREQMKSDRSYQIDRANQILVNKVLNIAKKKPVGVKAIYRKSSMNELVRKRERDKIIEENQQIVKRILERKPVYSMKKWKSEWKMNEKRLENICYHPYMLGKNKGSSRNLRVQTPILVFDKEIVIGEEVYKIQIFKSSDRLKLLAKREQASHVVEVPIEDAKEIVREERYEELAAKLNFGSGGFGIYPNDNS